MADIDEEKALQMNEDEVNKSLSEPVPEPVKSDPPPEPVKKDEPPAKEPAAKKEEPSVKDEPPKKDLPPGPVIYAGKLKGEEGLTKGINEIAKALKLSEPDLKILEELVQNKSWKALEILYRQMEGRYDATKAPEKEVAKAPEKVSDPVKPEDSAKLHQFYITEMNAEIKKHPIQTMYSRRGFKFPDSEKELAEMESTDPYLWEKTWDAINEVKAGIDTDVKRYYDSVAGVETANQKARTDGAAAIQQLNEKYSLELTDELIKGYVDKALAEKTSYEEKYGVDYPRENAVWQHFAVNVLPGLIENIKLKSEANGRTQGIEDLKTLKKDTRDTLSTGKLPGKKERTKDPEVDKDNPDEVALLTESQLDELLGSK